jgi:hypothetical protein
MRLVEVSPYKRKRSVGFNLPTNLFLVGTQKGERAEVPRMFVSPIEVITYY